MTVDGSFILHGALGSPYSLKLRAALRYRRLLFQFVQTGFDSPVLSQVRVPVIPILQWPDGRLANDSTPILLELEETLQDGRSILPDNPAERFLARLIEDMADEWLTKAMFVHRWTQSPDRDVLPLWLAYDADPNQPREVVNAAAAAFQARQLGRVPIVAGDRSNIEIVIETAEQVQAALEQGLAGGRRFLFGSRPSLADFGLYGQLSQLGVDPTPAARMRDSYPLLYRWLSQVDDLSGIEGAWQPGSSAALDGLLRLAAEIYLPYLLANAVAIESGQAQFELGLRGRTYAQPVVRYQRSCLRTLQACFAEEPDTVRAEIRRRFAAAGAAGDWEAILTGASRGAA